MTLLKIIIAAALMIFALASMLFAGFSLADHSGDRDVAVGFGLASAACAAALWLVASI